MEPGEFFEFCKRHEARRMDLKFANLLGTWHHCTFPVGCLDEAALEGGLGSTVHPFAAGKRYTCRT